MNSTYTCEMFSTEFMSILEKINTQDGRILEEQVMEIATKILPSEKSVPYYIVHNLYKMVLRELYPERAEYFENSMFSEEDAKGYVRKELPLCDAINLLINMLASSVSIYSKNDHIVNAARLLAKKYVSPLPIPTAPFNDDDPYYVGNPDYDED